MEGFRRDGPRLRLLRLRPVPVRTRGRGDRLRLLPGVLGDAGRGPCPRGVVQRWEGTGEASAGPAARDDDVPSTWAARSFLSALRDRRTHPAERKRHWRVSGSRRGGHSRSAGRSGWAGWPSRGWTGWPRITRRRGGGSRWPRTGGTGRRYRRSASWRFTALGNPAIPRRPSTSAGRPRRGDTRGPRPAWAGSAGTASTWRKTGSPPWTGGDAREAREWLAKAAEKGHAGARKRLAAIAG